jgi:hypothetical protein
MSSDKSEETRLEESISNVNEPKSDSTMERTDREISFSKRALLQAGWVAPEVLAVGLPRKIYAQSSMGEPRHSDVIFHSDTIIHSDANIHGDAGVHVDGTIHSDVGVHSDITIP